jgi:acetyl esterase/lipase
VERIPDIEFTDDGGASLRLDLYRPLGVRSEKPQPLILWLHGGGWMSGDKERGVERIFDLVRAGFLGASVSYRLSQEALFPAQIHDCKCAVRFLRAHARSYNIDPERIGAWGASAGGHLASLLAVTGAGRLLEGDRGWRTFSGAIQAACSWYGPSDLNLMDRFPRGVTPRLPTMSAESAEGRLVGGPIAERQDLVALANPLRYIGPSTPPVLLMHGARDDCVPVVSSERFHAALVEHRVRAQLHVIEDGGHNAESWGDRPLRIVKEFFEEHLGHRAEYDPSSGISRET